MNRKSPFQGGVHFLCLPRSAQHVYVVMCRIFHQSDWPTSIDIGAAFPYISHALARAGCGDAEPRQNLIRYSGVLNVGMTSKRPVRGTPATGWARKTKKEQEDGCSKE
jgi:hypothetical protein